LIGTLTQVVDKFTAFIESAEGQQAIQDGIKSIESFGDALLVIADIIVTLDKAGVGLLNFWKGVGEFFSDLGSSIGDGFVTAKDAVVGFVEDVVSFISALPGKIGSFLASLPGMFQKWLSDAFDAAFLAIGVGIGLVVAAFDRLPGLIMGAFNALPGLLSELWETVKTNTITAFDNVVSFIHGLGPRLIVAGALVINGIGSVFGRAFDLAKSKAKQGIDNIIGFVKGLGPRLTVFVAEVGGNIANAIKGMINRAISKINEGIGKVDALLPGDSLPGSHPSQTAVSSERSRGPARAGR
jgi:hypothetical protein